MAAEIVQSQLVIAVGQRASMRPRRMAAEISLGGETRGLRPPGFNEAAANGRGNQRQAPGAREGAADASMRPRRMAAEIVYRPGDPYSRPAPRFNEAAANGRGNP